ncbi:Rgg/GadR/MutR family transcriptional regulator [Schleiferilactobacillus shenzhenensis]|uniref:HTH cro/C1-type domain-containing protein n=1 Tax=Schleiferilactobacillus shenzhenensis LY-73 TaxID=1231336 RepID=U4TVV9_9LACO|nr:Rgg/GadR/MutR family transcriptional regulator [Schleiferilactobacillus shenzhenensis]ERL65978.1 hypothetical protein L248_2054 [Schleiferilactobacillus shenzhenensis LY-73]
MGLPLGEAFREFRTNRNISLRQAAGDIVTKSFLSKFERGQSAISADKLWALLARLNVTPAEFQYRVMGHARLPSDDFFVRLNQAVGNNRQNIAQADRLIAEAEARYAQSGLPTDRIDAIAARASKDTITDTVLPAEEINYVLDYLFETEEWLSYEVNVIDEILIFVSYGTRLQIAQSLIKHGGDFASASHNQEQVGNTLLNILALMIRDRRFADAQSLFGLLANNDMIQSSLFNALNFQTLRSADWFLTGRQEAAWDALHWAAATLHHLGQDEMGAAFVHQWHLLTHQAVDYAAVAAESKEK